MESRTYRREVQLSLLFNFQGALSVAISRRQLVYYITRFSVCQAFFQSFFKLFSEACLSDSLAALSQGLRYYTTHFIVCQGFFQSFFKLFSAACLFDSVCGPLSKAQILYHTLSTLSIPFFTFFHLFRVFSFSPAQSLLYILYGSFSAFLPFCLTLSSFRAIIFPVLLRRRLL